ncbi:MAG: hypothetical protein VB130_04065 [Clostridium sp.]|nr:hypothetical protein [Clostridium sp.]
MGDKEHLKRNYKSFSEFLSVVCSRELEYFILDSKFTSAFNYRMKKLIEEVKKEGKDDIEFSVIFNTQGEVVLIDANIIGGYVSNNYSVSMDKFYKGAALNKIIREVINGNEKSKKDFIIISYDIIYKTLEELYKDIKYKKEILNTYVEKYNLEGFKKETIPIVVAVLLITEDICKYLSFDDYILKDSIDKIISSKRV